jgi:hypothetical protein
MKFLTFLHFEMNNNRVFYRSKKSSSTDRFKRVIQSDLLTISLNTQSSAGLQGTPRHAEPRARLCRPDEGKIAQKTSRLKVEIPAEWIDPRKGLSETACGAILEGQRSE